VGDPLALLEGGVVGAPGFLDGVEFGREGQVVAGRLLIGDGSQQVFQFQHGGTRRFRECGRRILHGAGGVSRLRCGRFFATLRRRKRSCRQCPRKATGTWNGLVRHGVRTMRSLDGVQDALASLVGIDDATRLYRMELPQGSNLLVERWRGREALSQGFAWWVDLLATDATLDLDAWLGQPARLITRLADGSDCVRSGLVREASCIGSDGGLARYRLCLVPWTWLLVQGRHSRVFQDRSVVEIVEAVFADYAPLAAWQLGDEVGPFLGDRQRSYCVQYRESDFDFVSRLLAEEGLGWRLEEDDEAAAGHRLMLFADSAAQPEDGLSLAGG